MRPWLWIVAGVNGAGKTTIAKAVLKDVPVKDIVRRYARTLTHLADAIIQSDVSSIYDNSGSEPIRLLRTEQGRTTQKHPEPPAWFIAAMSGFTVQIGEMIRRRE